jgi:hypothetical protein
MASQYEIQRSKNDLIWMWIFWFGCILGSILAPDKTLGAIAAVGNIIILCLIKIYQKLNRIEERFQDGKIWK